MEHQVYRSKQSIWCGGVLMIPVSLETEFHLPSPCNLTYSMSNLSSSAVQGPFLHPSSMAAQLRCPSITLQDIKGEAFCNNKANKSEPYSTQVSLSCKFYDMEGWCLWHIYTSTKTHQPLLAVSIKSSLSSYYFINLPKCPWSFCFLFNNVGGRLKKPKNVKALGDMFFKDQIKEITLLMLEWLKKRLGECHV